MQRRKLKLKLFDLQQGRCPLCGEAIVTLSGTELHRAQASAGYSEENISLANAGVSAMAKAMRARRQSKEAILRGC
jgi:hypothetical protein